MLSCLRVDGSKPRCMTIESAADTLVFREFVKHFLCPSLRPGDVVIMDNLIPHKSAETLGPRCRGRSERTLLARLLA